MDNIKADIKDIISEVFSAEFVDTKDIPKIDLYMEQVTSFFEDALGENRRKQDDKILTKTMINNYTKHEVLPHPIKKKYTREHTIALAYIVMLKRVLSIQDIKSFFKLKNDNDTSLESQYVVFRQVMDEIYQQTQETLSTKLDNLDNILLEKGIHDTDTRLMTMIACLCSEASAFKLLSEKLIDRFEEKEETTSK